MRTIRFLLILMGALATLTLGAAPLAVAATPPPCHETPATHGDHGAPDQMPGKAMKAMACCATCVASPQPPLSSSHAAQASSDRPEPLRARLMDGLSPGPEPGPPRD